MLYIRKALAFICFLLFFCQVYPQSAGNIQFEDYVPKACPDSPVLKIGLIADPQYCDCEPGTERFFRETLWKLPQAVDTLNKYQVDFVMTLGDVVDQYYESYDAIMPFYDSFDMPFYHLLGNHEFYEISNEQMTTLITRYNMPGYYYDFSYGNWRFIVLDGTELAEYSRYLHPELAAEGDSLWESVQGQFNAETWNGGISRTQQVWIRSKIEEAAVMEQNVMLFSHFTLFPDSIQNSLWNKDTIISLLSDYPNIVAYINGHTHEGSYGMNGLVHYLGIQAMVDTPDKNSFAVLEIWPKELRVKGFGNVPDRYLPYNVFKKKEISLMMSDTVLKYNMHKGSLIGKISHISSYTGALVNYLLEDSVFSNRFFTISGDSLLLGTDEDLSVTEDLRIKVFAVDCEADTFSKNFALHFDTTVLNFKYTLSDTLISVYEKYYIIADSLIENFSRFGLGVSCTFDDNLLASCAISDDTITITPGRVGITRVRFSASDSYTGKVFSQYFNLSIHDPLNTTPYHIDTINLKYTIQPGDSVSVELNTVFLDTDNDTLQFSILTSDTLIAKAWLHQGLLQFNGLKAGIVIITAIADDNRGGTDTVSIEARVNTRPVRIKPATEFLFQFDTDCFRIYFDSIFADPDGDTIKYTVYSDVDSVMVDESGRLLLCPDTAGVFKVFVTLDDGISKPLEDSIAVRFNKKPESLISYYHVVLNHDEGLSLDLDTLFMDENADTLFYSISFFSQVNPEIFFYKSILEVAPLENADTVYFYITASDNFGGYDSIVFNLVFLSKPTGIESSASSGGLMVYPNPASGTFKIQYIAEETVNLGILLTRIDGTIVQNFGEIPVIQGENAWEFKLQKPLAPGVYVLNIFSCNQIIAVKRIIMR